MRPRRTTPRALRAEKERLILVLVEVAREIGAPASCQLVALGAALRAADDRPLFRHEIGIPTPGGNNTSCGDASTRASVPPTRTGLTRPGSRSRGRSRCRPSFGARQRTSRRRRGAFLPVERVRDFVLRCGCPSLVGDILSSAGIPRFPLRKRSPREGSAVRWNARSRARLGADRVGTHWRPQRRAKRVHRHWPCALGLTDHLADRFRLLAKQRRG